MDYSSIAQEIIQLKNADLALRDRLIREGQLGEGYNEEMAQLHNSNADRLNEIIDAIGYPTIDKVGEEGSEAAWLVIQHAIGQPDFMKMCAGLLEEAASQGDASHKSLAYLTDRIAVFEGRPQLYGTQFDWDDDGVLSPKFIDELDKVNERRRSIGLNTLEEQTVIIRRRAQDESQSPPLDREKRKLEFDQWRKAVGWVR